VPGLLRARGRIGSRVVKDARERDGDHFVINGQKTWTSYAKYARWCAVLARTDRDAPTQSGDLLPDRPHTEPGVQVRPLRQNHR